ncbi:uncharacterized protein LOC128965208 [Oppia nitens]|uniref:uncharacterized protein LOC128965208 n=1 Tax=Oppia nitens TaxID=1686743 RepID=UPI0023DA6F41|nr:uncharacterized protein LOC128965208 [Oppia nitens]
MMANNNIIIITIISLLILIVSLDTAHIDADDVNDIIIKRTAMISAPVASNQLTYFNPFDLIYDVVNELLEPLMGALGLPGLGIDLLKSVVSQLVWPVIRFLWMAAASVLRAITGVFGGGGVTTKATVTTDDSITDTVTNDVDLTTSTTDET